MVHKGVIATQDFGLISYALRDYHIKTTLPLTLALTSPHNLLNSHTATIDSPQKQLKQKNNKYIPLIASIASTGWKIEPLIVITAGARATAHIHL